MAVTLNFGREIIRPAFNENTLVMTSPNSGQTNFNFLTQIYDESNTLLSTLKIKPNLDGYGIVDIHKHTENLVGFDILDYTAYTETYPIYNTWNEYKFKLGEEYSGTSATYGGFNNAYIMNSVVSWMDNADWDPYERSVRRFEDTPLLTSIPANGYEVGLDSRCFINYYTEGGIMSTWRVQNGEHASIDIETKAYGNGNNLLWTSIQPTTTGTSTELLSRVSIGPWNINQRAENDPATYSAYTITDNTKYYTMRLFTSGYTDTTNELFLNNYFFSAGTATKPYITANDSNSIRVREFSSDLYRLKDGDTITFSGYSGITDFDGTYTVSMTTYPSTEKRVPQIYGDMLLLKSPAPTGFTSDQVSGGTVTLGISGTSSQTYRFDVKDYCSDYEQYQFLYVDKWGSLVGVTFNMVSKTKVRINKKSYRKNLGSYNASTGEYGYNAYDRSKSRLQTVVDEIITVNSDWVSEGMSAVIDEMVESPEVYHLKDDGTLWAIDILTNNYEVHKSVNNKLKNYTFDFEYTVRNPQQKF